MHPVRALFFAGIAATLAACSGAGATSGAPVVPAQPAQMMDALARGGLSARVVIRVPGRRHHRLGERYISPSTQSIVISAQETAPKGHSPILSYANIIPGSKNCTGTGTSLPYTCTVTIGGLVAGATYSFTFVTYDRTQTSAKGPYAGTTLAQNKVSKKIATGTVNTINVTLEGIPVSFAVAPVVGSTPSPFGGGVPSGLYFGALDSPTWTVTALDADQNYIVGPGSPTIAALVSGATGGVAMAPASGTIANQFVVSATGVGSGTLQLLAPVPGSSSPLSVNVPLSASWFVSTIAGVPTKSGFFDGSAPQAQFNAPEGLIVNPADGNIYVADYNNCAIRMIDRTTHAVSTYAGAGPSHCNYQNGTGTGAWFDSPCDLAADHSGNLYVTDYGSLGEDVRKIAPGGVVTLFAGHNGDIEADGPLGTGALAGPIGIAYDPDDNDLYVVDYDQCTIRRVTVGGSSPGTISTIAGSAGNCDSSGSDFNGPEGIVYAGNATLYVADYNNCEVRRITNIDSAPSVDTNAAAFAGSYTDCHSKDGTGPSAGFSATYYLDYDSARQVLYVADYGNSIRKVTTGGVVTTIAGNIAKSGYGLGWGALLYGPSGVAYDSALNVLFEVDPTDEVVQEISL